MTKRVIDLSVEELAAMGAKAARLAVLKSQSADQVITGTVDVFEHGKAASSLAQLLPSGTVTLVRMSERNPTSNASASAKSPRNRAID
jgi:hypothetical protein